MKRRDDCPEPERLAALAEGRVAEPARSALMAHLDGCAQCHTVFAETVRALAEEPAMTEPTSPKPEPAAEPRRFRPRWWIMAAPLAAAAAIYLAFTVLRPDYPANAYQTAMAQVALRDGSRVLEFAFPTEVDALDQARTLRSASGWEPSGDVAWLDSVGLLEDWIATQSNHRRGHLDLASLYLVGGNPDLALAVIQPFAEDRPNDAEAQALLVLARYRADILSLQQAAARMDHLAKRFPNSAMIAYNLAELLGQQGNDAEAKRCRQRYLSLAEDGPRADHARELIQ